MWTLFFAEELALYYRQKWFTMYGEKMKTPVDVSTPV
jgi:hypothetical protein